MGQDRRPLTPLKVCRSWDVSPCETRARPSLSVRSPNCLQKKTARRSKQAEHLRPSWWATPRRERKQPAAWSSADRVSQHAVSSSFSRRIPPTYFGHVSWSSRRTKVEGERGTCAEVVGQILCCR